MINYDYYFKTRSLKAVAFRKQVLETNDSEGIASIYNMLYAILAQFFTKKYKEGIMQEFKNRDLYSTKWLKSNVQSGLQSKLNQLSKYLSEEILESVHKAYRVNIVSKFKIPRKCNALAYQRQSVDKNLYLKQDVAKSSNLRTAKILGYKPYSISVTASGYSSPVLAILEDNTNIKAVFVESVDRYARNLGLTLDLLDYCAINQIKLYVGSAVMNRGVHRVSMLLLAVFAEYELTSKQTKFSFSLLNVIKLELQLIKPEQLTEAELKLFYNLQYVEQEDLFLKSARLSLETVNAYVNCERTKTGKYKVSNYNLVINAVDILNLLTDQVHEYPPKRK